MEIVDLSLSNTEAEWALKNVGSDAFRSHSTFSTIDTGNDVAARIACAAVSASSRDLSDLTCAHAPKDAGIRASTAATGSAATDASKVNVTSSSTGAT